MPSLQLQKDQVALSRCCSQSAAAGRAIGQKSHRYDRGRYNLVCAKKDQVAPVNEPQAKFEQTLLAHVSRLNAYSEQEDGQWTVKGFIDVFKNIYTISADTKIVSKILEIHIFPELLKFADEAGYQIVLADHQNYYPDISFVSVDDPTIKFAVDLKTTYRVHDKPGYCNGFTLGSHGAYFIDRTGRKNIQFPYSEYAAHYCLGVIYDRALKTDLDETRIYDIADLKSITSVISNLQFFLTEKWKIASDKSGSGNTANIGSINHVSEIVAGRGLFSKLGEGWFDDYWMNYGKISVTSPGGETKKITDLESFVRYRGGDSSLIIYKHGSRKRARTDG